MEKLREIVEKANSLNENYSKVGNGRRTAEWIETQEKLLEEYKTEAKELLRVECPKLSPENRTEFVNCYEKGKIVYEKCIKILSVIKERNQATTTKMAGLDLGSVSRIIKEYNGSGRVEDYVDAITFYNKKLSPDASVEFADYVYSACLKGEAKDAFDEAPLTVTALISTLLERFTPKETIGELNQKMSQCVQGNRSVSKYAGEIESLTARLITLHMKGRAADERKVVKSMVKEAACSSFKNGLRMEVQPTVIASGAVSFADALTKALEAEAAQKHVAQVNAIRGVTTGYVRPHNGEARGYQRGYPQGRSGWRPNFRPNFRPNYSNFSGNRFPMPPFRPPNYHYTPRPPQHNHSSSGYAPQAYQGPNFGQGHQVFAPRLPGNNPVGGQVYVAEEKFEPFNAADGVARQVEQGQVNIVEDTFFRS